MYIEYYQASIDSVKDEIKNSARLSYDLDEYLDCNPRPKYTIPDKPPSTNYKSKFTASLLGSPSGKSLCGDYTIGCKRKMFYKYTGAPKKMIIPASLRKRWDAGSAIHEMFQRYLMDMSSKQQYSITDAIPEFEIVPEMGGYVEKYTIVSKVDLHYSVSSWPYIMEIKTDAQETFNKRTKPSPAHITQANIYMALLDIPVSNLFYISFSPEMPIKEYIVEFDSSLWQACVDKMDYVISCIGDEKIPEREGSVWFCKSCEYKHICRPPEVTTAKVLL